MNISISVWAVNAPSHTLTDGYKITMYKRWFCNDIRQFRPMASTHVISVEDLCCRRFCFLINAYFANQLCLFWRLAQMMRYMLLLNVCVGLSKSLTYKWTQDLIKKTAKSVLATNHLFKSAMKSRFSLKEDPQHNDTENGDRCSTLYIFYQMGVFSSFHFILKCLRLLYTILLIFKGCFQYLEPGNVC